MISLCRTEEWPEGRCLLVPGTPHPPPTVHGLWSLPACLCLPRAWSGLRA